MSIKIFDSSEIFAEDKVKAYIKDFELTDFFTKIDEQTYNFKENDIPKEITGLEENLIFEKVLQRRTYSNIYKFSTKISSPDENNCHVIKTDKEFIENSNGILINLHLHLLQDNINRFLERRIFFTPQIKKLFYNKDYNHYIILNEHWFNILELLEESSSNHRVEIMISLIYNITTKLIFLQANLGFMHNDLKLDNIVYTRRSTGDYDFCFIDIESSRIEIDGNYICGEHHLCLHKDMVDEGKDMFCLIHSIISEFKKFNYNKEADYLTFFFEEVLGIEIFPLYTDYQDFNQFSESEKNSIKEHHRNRKYYNDKESPFFLCYYLNDYPTNFYPINLITNLNLHNYNNFSAQLRRNLLLGKQCLNLYEDNLFTINNCPVSKINIILDNSVIKNLKEGSEFKLIIKKESICEEKR